ncbi:MAG: TRAP transporter large permease subunit [Rhodobacteraceae bacterium]|nr:TRAP transporter large permease subunit [Paracoccaceae bacterium]
MLFGLDGIEIGLIITFSLLFAGIMSGFPVGFAIGGSAIIAFGILALLDGSGLLLREAIDHSSPEYLDLRASGVSTFDISRFRYPDLPTEILPLFDGGWQQAVNRNLSFIVNRMNERVIAGQSIETLLAVLMFVLMGITLERSRIANELLTTMAGVFGPLPGGLAVSVVVVGAFLAASTGIVGATVVTMGLLSLPTMLRNRYSPEIATGVITASGTLGQIIPPSIVIVLLGTLAGDLYSTAQEERAQALGCSDALTYLGEAAVVSVGTLFQAAVLPGLMLATLYALYAFGYALMNPDRAPPVPSMGGSGDDRITARHAVVWFLLVPVAIIAFAVASNTINLTGSQNLTVTSVASEVQSRTFLRTNVSEQCQAAMIDLHGRERWDESLAARESAQESGFNPATSAELRTPEEIEEIRQQKIADAAPIGTGVITIYVMLALIMTTAQGIRKTALVNYIPGIAGILLALLVDAVLLPPDAGPGVKFLMLLIPTALCLYSCRHAVAILAGNQVFRVLFPPLVLIVAVLGSILGGITNPTPAAALGAAGAILLAAQKVLEMQNKSSRFIMYSAFAIVIMLLIGVNFDLRVNVESAGLENWLALLIGLAAYHVAFGGLLYACWVLFRSAILTPVVRETAKVVSMVFTILIGSQVLNLVIISFGGEHYIQEYLRSFEREWVVFLIVMLVLFILGFVLDFLEIIYIVIPIVGPVIYGGTLDPKWVTVMIAVNLQTSFLTPPFGFALFYLRGVAPREVTTRHIYRGVIPFVVIQVVGLGVLWMFPSIVTIVPDLIPN